MKIFKCYVIFLLIINKGIIYKFYWSPMESAGLWQTPVNPLVHWSPVDLISGKVWSESRESAGIWHIPEDYTGLDLPIWPV